MEFPPGVATNFGKLENASEFIQARLPGTMSHDGKRSRCVSFLSAGSTFSSRRGTTRTKDSAIQAVASWCWTWWESLEAHEKDAVEASLKSSKRGVREVEGTTSTASSSKKSKR